MQSTIISAYKKQAYRWAIKIVIADLIIVGVLAAAMVLGEVLEEMDAATMKIIAAIPAVCLLLIIFVFIRVHQSAAKFEKQMRSCFDAGKAEAMDAAWENGVQAGGARIAGEYLIYMNQVQFELLPLSDIREIYLIKQTFLIVFIPITRLYYLEAVDSRRKKHQMAIKKKGMKTLDQLVDAALAINGQIKISKYEGQ